MKLSTKNRRKRDDVAGIRLVTHLKLPHNRRPKFTDKLVFPDDITELAGANVSDLLGKYTQLFAYVQEDLSKTNRALIGLDTEERRRRLELQRENPRWLHIEKWKREALFDTDEELESINEERQAFLQRKESAVSFIAIYDKYIAALSRELTRKSSEEQQIRYQR